MAIKINDENEYGGFRGLFFTLDKFILGELLCLCPTPFIWVPGINVRSISKSCGSDKRSGFDPPWIPFSKLLFCNQLRFVKSRSNGFLSVGITLKQLLLKFTLTFARSTGLLGTELFTDLLSFTKGCRWTQVCGFSIFLLISFHYMKFYSKKLEILTD